jgi:hypothetical protein
MGQAFFSLTEQIGWPFVPFFNGFSGSIFHRWLFAALLHR